jgi:hypothetical protein
MFLFRKDMLIEWNPRCNPKWVPGRVIEDQSSVDGAVVIVLDGNEQRIAVVPGQLRVKPGPNLPALGAAMVDRIVQRAQDAAEEAAEEVRRTTLSGAVEIDGFSEDIAKEAAGAAIQQLGDEIGGTGGTYLHQLADFVRGIPALKAV